VVDEPGVSKPPQFFMRVVNPTGFGPTQSPKSSSLTQNRALS
jgi:hypothetical protein